ncbi:MAG: hypothetical protein ACI87W_002604, partial [Halieaceae bacterium]
RVANAGIGLLGCGRGDPDRIVIKIKVSEKLPEGLCGAVARGHQACAGGERRHTPGAIVAVTQTQSFAVG